MAAYITVAASQTGAVLGFPSGSRSDQLVGFLIIPATTSPGAVTLLDGTTSITIFPGGASSVADLKPFWVPWGASNNKGVWSVTTGANISVVAVGQFA